MLFPALSRTGPVIEIHAVDAEHSYLALDEPNKDPMNQLQGHSITCRIAAIEDKAIIDKILALPVCLSNALVSQCTKLHAGTNLMRIRCPATPNWAHATRLTVPALLSAHALFFLYPMTCDQTIEFTGVMTSDRCPIPLSRAGYRDPETGKRYVFLTNNLVLAASTRAEIYKSRWQIELLFK